MMFVIFDLLGTLFSFDKVKDRFREKGLQQELAELWLARLMQYSMASGLAGKYTEFKVIARSVLAQIFARGQREQIREQQFEAALASLQELEPWEDAGKCLQTLRSDGHRLVALTNCCRDDALRLLQNAGLWKWFERLCTADTVRACKPHPALYEHLFRTLFAGPYDCCMVSAHGSDILGAASLGMNSVYVRRLEAQWPFPDYPPGLLVPTLQEVPKAVSGAFGRPAASAEKMSAEKGRKWYGEA